MHGSERAIFLLASIAAIAGVLFGFDEGVIAGALHLLRADFPITPVSEGFMTAAVPLGALMGAIVAGRLADPVGRRSLLLAAAALFCAGALFAALAGSMWMLTFARLVLGLAIGVAGVMAPLYIAESVPPARRGMLVSVYQLAITIGILSAYGVNLAFSESWRLMFACGILPGLALFFGMARMSDSPRWLVQKGRDAEAQQALARLTGTTADDPAVTMERERIAKAVVADQHLTGGVRDLFTVRVRPALIVAVGLFALQQLCGINAVIYYAPTIFAHAGFDSTGTQLMATIGIGVVNVAMTIVGMLLIDRLGRRRLLLAGFAGAAASLALIAYAAASTHPSSPVWAMAGVALFIASFALSLGPLPHVMMSEVFPLNVRGVGMGLASISNWGLNFVVVFSFPVLLDLIGLTGVFSLFALVCVAGLVFTVRTVPETRGVSLEQIERHLMSGLPLRDLGLPLGARA